MVDKLWMDQGIGLVLSDVVFVKGALNPQFIHHIAHNIPSLYTDLCAAFVRDFKKLITAFTHYPLHSLLLPLFSYKQLIMVGEENL